MARRRNNEGLFDLLVQLPWWLSLIMGVGIFVYLKLNPLPAESAVIKDVIVWYGLKFFSWVCFLAFFISGILTVKRKILLASVKDIESIRAMSWREFETLVGEAYRRQGYMVVETGGGGADGGIDLVLTGKGQKVVVQCKRWKTTKVGVKIVREMYGIMVAKKADRVIIASSGSYTKDAVEFAHGKPIELVDGKALVRLIRDVRQAHTDTSPQSAQASIQKPLKAPSVASDSTATVCPKCGSPMVLRTAKRGANAGNQFWGCSRFPKCREIVNV